MQDMRADGDAAPLQYLRGHCAGKDQRRRQAAGKMAAAAEIVISAVTDFAAVIGMTGPHDMAQLVVVLGAVVAVADDGA